MFEVWLYDYAGAYIGAHPQGFTTAKAAMSYMKTAYQGVPGIKPCVVDTSNLDEYGEPK